MLIPAFQIVFLLSSAKALIGIGSVHCNLSNPCPLTSLWTQLRRTEHPHTPQSGLTWAVGCSWGGGGGRNWSVGCLCGQRGHQGSLPMPPTPVQEGPGRGQRELLKEGHLPTSLVPRSVDADLRVCLLLRFPCFIPVCPLKNKNSSTSPEEKWGPHSASRGSGWAKPNVTRGNGDTWVKPAPLAPL